MIKSGRGGVKGIPVLLLEWLHVVFCCVFLIGPSLVAYPPCEGAKLGAGELSGGVAVQWPQLKRQQPHTAATEEAGGLSLFLRVMWSCLEVGAPARVGVGIR